LQLRSDGSGNRIFDETVDILSSSFRAILSPFGFIDTNWLWTKLARMEIFSSIVSDTKCSPRSWDNSKRAIISAATQSSKFSTSQVFCEFDYPNEISIWTSNLACREGTEPNQGDERMAIGLIFEEYVELKLMPPKHADRAFVTAAEHMRDEAFPMALAQAAWHVRTRGYDGRPESLELLVKQQTVEPVDVDAWTRADVDAVCDYFEQHGFYVPYAEACRVLGCSYASFLRALKDAAERETAKYGIQVRVSGLAPHRVPGTDLGPCLLASGLAPHRVPGTDLGPLFASYPAWRRTGCLAPIRAPCLLASGLAPHRVPGTDLGKAENFSPWSWIAINGIGLDASAPKCDS
jgi:hypothetical protein